MQSLISTIGVIPRLHAPWSLSPFTERDLDRDQYRLRSISIDSMLIQSWIANATEIRRVNSHKIESLKTVM